MSMYHLHAYRGSGINTTEKEKKSKKAKKKKRPLNLFLGQNFNQNVLKIFKPSSGEECKLHIADFKEYAFWSPFSSLHHLMPQHCTKNKIL